MALRQAQPTVVLGDLNASPFGSAYEDLTGPGLRGAHEAVGRGLATTWPNGAALLPPLRLDHVLISPRLRVTSVREGRGAGSDHRPVIARLALAPSVDAGPGTRPETLEITGRLR